MGGIWIVVAASLLGVVSIALIAGSLVADSRARKRSRQMSVVSGSYPPVPSANPVPMAPIAPVAPIAPIAPVAPPPTAHASARWIPGPRPSNTGETVVVPPPESQPQPPPPDQATQFLTVDDMFALADERVEPTQLLSDEDLRIAASLNIPMPAQPPPVAPASPPVAVTPSPIPRSPIPAASIPTPSQRPSQPVPSKPVAPANSFAPPDPSAFVKPAVDTGPTPYVGYVAPRSHDAGDDDDDDDDDDPETELVHQAELLRLMMKGKPPQ